MAPVFSMQTSRAGVSETGFMEGCRDDIENLDLSLRPEQLYLESLVSTTEGTSGVLQESSRKKRDLDAPERQFKQQKRFNFNDHITETVIEMLESIVVTPPKKIRNTPEWQDDAQLRNWTTKNNEVKLALDRWNIRTRRMKTIDFIDFFKCKTTDNLLFQDFERRGNVYHDIETSTNLALEFLEFQFPTNAQDFVGKLVAVLDMEEAKINTFDVLSPPSCGKTWFFDMVVDFYLNVGHVKNMNRNQNFPFQDCVDRRVLMWNEPSTSPENYDQLKTIFGGDRCPAGIKHDDDIVIYRTPLICTGNGRLFPDDPAFEARRHCFKFNYWPKLKTLGQLKLIPLAWINVLNKYFPDKYNAF